MPCMIIYHGQHEIRCCQELDSTNLEIKRLSDSLSGGSVVLADSQTAGRGRMQRAWLSRSGAGAWFSLLVRPERRLEAEKTTGLVFVAALSMARALYRLTGAGFKIKWPNDIVLNGKKLCGIMCEMRTRGSCLDYAVLGIGVNLAAGSFPEDLPYASSVENETGLCITNIEAVKAFLDEFDQDYEVWEREGLAPALEAIRPFSATLGSEVIAYAPEGNMRGRATDFAPDGALIIENEKGQFAVRYGDVSVRGVMGYQ